MDLCESQASLVYRVNSRIAKATHGETLSQKTRKKGGRKEGGRKKERERERKKIEGRKKNCLYKISLH